MTNDLPAKGFQQILHHPFLAFCLSILVVLLTGPMAFASPILQINGDGQLTGASGVDVGGTLYDVMFVEGTCLDVYHGCTESDFPWHDYEPVILAAQALLDQVFLDTSLGNFDTSPSLIFGCENQGQCRPSTPYRKRNGVDIRSRDASNDTDESKDKVRLMHLIDSEDFANNDFRVWAVWGLTPVTPTTNQPPTPAPVPEPSTILLFGSGLAGLIGYRMRKKAQV